MSAFFDALIEYIEAKRELEAKKANADPYEGGYYLQDDADHVDELREVAERLLNEHIEEQVRQMLKMAER